MRQVVTNRLSLDAATFFAHAPLSVLDQLLTRNSRVGNRPKPTVADCYKCGSFGFTQRPHFFVLIEVSVDHLLHAHALTIQAIYRAWHGQLGLTSFHPRLSDLLAVERLGFLINWLTVSIDPYLRTVGSSVVLALAWSDSAHF